jgi:hypothetical protein
VKVAVRYLKSGMISYGATSRLERNIIMNKEDWEMGVRLTEILFNDSDKFLLDNMKEVESMESVLSIVTSASMSAMYNSLRSIASQDKKTLEMINNFIKQIDTFIEKYFDTSLLH